jgi:hypothetical protein
VVTDRGLWRGTSGHSEPAAAALPQQRIETGIGYVARCAVGIIAVILVSAAVAKVADGGFSGLGEILDGRDVLTGQDNPNYVRNLLELTSFLATTGVLATAIWAFAFTKSQIKEARDTRLATLYATLEQRWSSEQMLRSKALFSQMMLKYSAYRSDLAEEGKEAVSLPEFAHEFIVALQSTHQYDYFTLMALPEYLQYIGMLWKQKYLSIEDIDYILGMVFIQVASTFKVHIDHPRREGAEMKSRNALRRAPEEIYCLSDLEKAFLKRYGDDAPTQAY